MIDISHTDAADNVRVLAGSTIIAAAAAGSRRSLVAAHTGRRSGTFTVEATGAPVQVHGTLELVRRGAKASTNTTEVTVECKVPLIGGKIADLVAGDTRRALDHEHTWMTEHLESS